jgi:hypothetical protein
MVIFIVTTSILLFVILFITPPAILYFLIKRKVNFLFLRYIIFGLILTAIIFTLFAWWTHFSDKLLLSNYGYNFDSMNDIERFENVSVENMDEVKRIENSIMGIGWPLKAMMMFPLFSIYLFVIYLIGYGYKKYKTLNT